MKEIIDEIKKLKEEVRRLRAMLFPYADAKSISGSSWAGCYLIGDDKSIKELNRLLSADQAYKTCRTDFDERINFEREKKESAEQMYLDRCRYD